MEIKKLIILYNTQVIQVIMKRILYTRVSTLNQGNESLNLQNQLCLQFINSIGQTLDGGFQEIGSAYSGPQTTLNNILNTHHNCCLYVLNVSRFSRNVTNGINMLTRATSKNINVHFIEENLDSMNQQHSHQIRVKLSEAQLESETLSQRVNSRNELLRKQGWKFGNPIYGKEARLKEGVRKFYTNSREKKIIDFIIQARTGTSVRTLNNKLKKINPNADPIYFYDSDGITKINFFDKAYTLTFQEIADLLNDYEIDKRNKDWSASSVNHVFNQNYSITNSMKNMSLSV